MTSPIRSGILGIVHRAGGDWRLVAADLSGSRPKILASEALPSSAGHERVDAWLESQKVTSVLQVVPASASVSRTFILPNAEDDALDQALRLQAETWLLAGTPDHRYGGGVLPAAPGESNRTGVVFAWPDGASASVDAAAITPSSRWVPEAAALTALLDAERPAEPIVSLDRRRGSIGLVLCHPGGAAVRGTAAELGAAEWAVAVRRIVVETALADDHSTSFATRIADDVIHRLDGLASDGATCIVPSALQDAVRRRFVDAPVEDSWWQTFGVAAGSILAATGPMSAAAGLKRDAELIRVSRSRQLAASIARPQTAVAAAGLALVIAALAGPVSARVRLALLEQRYGDLSGLKEQVDAASTRMAIYDASADDGLPMSKLLGDIACNTPLGIELDFVSINGSSRQFLVRGSSLTQKDVSGRERTVLMQDSFGQSGLFSQLSPRWEDEESKILDRYTLTLSGNVTDPHRRVEYDVEQDFGRWTAWERKIGIGPTTEDETTAIASDDGDVGEQDDGGGAPATAVASRDTTVDPITRRTPTGTGGTTPNGGARPSGGSGGSLPTTAIPEAGGTRTAADRPRRDGPGIGGRGTGLDADDSEVVTGGSAASLNVPEPRSETVINAMNKQEAMAAFVELSRIRLQMRRIEGEEELKARLDTEYRLVNSRVRELNRGGS
ncbi:MAG: hypothetical protein AB8G96_12565 [Phycisphaerales bacterium]